MRSFFGSILLILVLAALGATIYYLSLIHI